MKLFRDYTFKWWQTVAFKFYLLSAGLIIGAIWPEFFRHWMPLLLAIFILLLVYMSNLFFRGKV